MFWDPGQDNAFFYYPHLQRHRNQGNSLFNVGNMRKDSAFLSDADMGMSFVNLDELHMACRITCLTCLLGDACDLMMEMRWGEGPKSSGVREYRAVCSGITQTDKTGQRNRSLWMFLLYN